MAASDYWHCLICDTKALYDPSGDDAPDVEVLHTKCFNDLRAKVDALTKELEQATLYCSRPDGVCLRKRWTDGGS